MLSTMYEVENTIKIAYNNVCNVAKKWKAIANNHKINGCDIVILAETWLSTKQSVHKLYNIENFHQMRMDSTVMPSHRGLLVYWKRDKNYLISTNQSPCLEICRCHVPYINTMLSIFGIYRPPSSIKQDFKKELFRHIASCNVHYPKILAGDFNIDVKKDMNLLQEMEQNFNLAQFIDKSTTFEGTTTDLVFSNLSNITAVVLPNTWSLHHTLNIAVPK